MKNFIQKAWSRSPLGVLVVVMALSVTLGYRLGGEDSQQPQPPGTEHSRAGATEVKARERMIYVCPMMDVPPMESPGKCPVCGMELVSVSAGNEEDKAGPPRLKLSPEALSQAEIQVAPVESKFVSAEVRLFGQIDYDPAHLTKITAFMPGVIDRVYVKRAGQFVRWGDPLFDIYSSDLLETQKQLIDAMKYVPSFLAFQAGTPHVARDVPVQARAAREDPDTRSPEEETALKTIDAIRHKLSILGLPKRDIDQLMKVGEATGIATVYASMYGQIIEQNAFEGTYVNTGTTIFTIADPQYVWAKLDAYEADYPWIRKGQEVSFVTDAYPGERFGGKVVYIDPVFNAKTRSFTIGVISTDDRGGRMKAGMLVRAVIDSQLTGDGKISNEPEENGEPPLVIPASAPLITGKRAVVYVAVPGGEGVFEGREVVLGPKGKDYYVVLGGLNEGERVVVNGNFKIDSAVQILAKSSMMEREEGSAVAAHQNPGGSEVMQENYTTERMRSRQKSKLETEDMDAGTAPSMGRPGHVPADERPAWPSTIRRRKPGAYGDTTRQIPPSR